MNMQPYLRLQLDLPKPGRGMRAEEIVNVLKAATSKGELPKGSRLPPVRVLAHQLGISKNTVSAASDELVAQNLVESRARKGYFLKEQTARSQIAPRSKSISGTRITSAPLAAPT